ncbi:MAG: hypothetical protein ACLPKE_13440 [Streptosporangiaceae bacterium]
MPERIDIEASLERHFTSWPDERIATRLRADFLNHGITILRDIVPDAIRYKISADVYTLLQQHAERRDLLLETTDKTPRFMSVVRSETIASSDLSIPNLYQAAPLMSMLAEIADEGIFACPSSDEEFLITRQERRGDTHGWHWGDFSFALIWLIEMPPPECGGMLQCVPRTAWDKSNPQIANYLRDNQVDSYSFRSGDIYLLRTDTTLHRTVPLNRDCTRIILNMTYASASDLSKKLNDDDRWWEDGTARAAKRVE